MTQKPFQLLRISGVLACVVSGLLTITDQIHMVPTNSSVTALQIALTGKLPLWTIILLEAFGFGINGWSVWLVTRIEEVLAPRKRILALIYVQVLLAFALFSLDTFYIVAAEIGLFFSLRYGIAWIVGLAVSETALYFSFPQALSWLYPGAYGKMAWTSTVPVFAAASLIYHLLAYSMGRLGAREYRQGKELAAMQQVETESARLAERLSIARELHDSVGHHLTALSVHLQLASRLVTGNGASAVGEAYQITQSLLSDVRNVVTNLRDMDSAQLTAAINAMASSVPTPQIHVDVDSELDDIEPITNHVLFRCAQEAITNAIRHSNARNLWLEVRHSSVGYELKAHDDGKGVALLRSGNGLNGIRERVADLGGDILIRTAPGKGFELTVKIPHRKEAL
jgi:signal transduction histidine kinase